MLAKDLIDQLERRGLLDQEIIEALREQLEQGGTRVTPEAVAKLLVDNGQLTRFQATKLIGEIRSGEYQDPEEVEVAAIDDEELGILGEENEVVEVAVEEVEVEAVAVEAEPVAVEAVAVEAMPVEAVAVDAMPLGDASSTGSVSDAMSDGGGEQKPRPKPRHKKQPENKSQWDSFKIYGRAGIVVLLLLTGGALYFVLRADDIDEVIQAADKLYDMQSYEQAQESYIGYLKTFGEESQYSSRARTRIIMTALYKAKAFTDPDRTLEVEREKLPQLKDELGLDDEKADLAALLVNVAQNFADFAVKEPETEKKKELLGYLDEQIGFVMDGQYVTSSTRTQLGTQLTAVEEAKKRVQRDIKRNERLDEAVNNMTTALDKKETRQAYDVRFDLLRDFPELEKNPRLVKLIESASGIQKELVAASTKLPKTDASAPAADSMKSIVLASPSGNPVPSLRGETIYFRAGGSVLAFAADTGEMRWRSFVGFGQDHIPLQMEGGAGVLLSESKSLEIQRRKPDDGSIRWRSIIGEPFAEPVNDRDTVFVSTFSGSLISLDAESGEANWSATIPQPLDVGPGVDARAKQVFVPGNHSNMYVLSSRDGRCIDSYYIGHKEGSIVVPPVPLLGHLFVIENYAPDTSRVHILKVNKDGSLKKAQDHVLMTGNVKVKPIVIQQRRLIVLTDRGQVSVYDVEPTAEREQVTVAAKQLSSYDAPTSTQMAVGKSQMWITGTRIGRYELQINTGRVVPDWFKHEGDTFIGRPFATEDALIHARVLRGTTGVRVQAVDPKSGEEIWRTDVGVPVAMIRRTDGGFHAVTSQASLFKLTSEDLSRGWTEGPVENPGGDGVEMRFERPIVVNDEIRVLLNQEARGQLAIYDPTRRREKLRLVTLGLPEGRQSNHAIFSGGGLLLSLDSGRAALMKFQTGESMASPFQPTSDPVGQVEWSNFVGVPDDDGQVVVGDSRKKLYRIRVGDSMRELASGDLDAKLLGQIAGVGKSLVGTMAGPSADFIVGYDMGGLSQKFKKLLDNRITWGPVSAGEVCLVKTDDSKIRGFDENGDEKFAFDVPAGNPVGLPTMAGDKMILAGAPGWIVAFDPGSGQLLGKSTIGQPIFATPLGIGNNLLVPGTEGVVYIVPVPTGA